MDNINKLISEHTKAVLLLTTFFNSNESRYVKPLTENGYGYFARWLNFYGYKPVDLLDQITLVEIGHRWEQPDSHSPVKKKILLKSLDRTIADITLARLQSLLGRGASLSMALDKWSAAGIWILDRSHEYYPAHIRKQLKDKAPAILFGVGNPKLLAQKSVGFVGSRDCQQDDFNATSHYVKQVNDAGFQVVSGAAKGIDTHAMLSSLDGGNTAVGIVADSLFKSSASSQWRNHLKNQSLVLISPFYPESRFTPANAMQRNKYIYLLSQATIVICSTVSGPKKKSGTWEGATENLKNAWVPLLVSNHKQPNHSGNQALLNGIPKLQSTAHPLSLNDSVESITALISRHSFSSSTSRASAAASAVHHDNLFGGSSEVSAEQEVIDSPLNSDHADLLTNSKSLTVSETVDTAVTTDLEDYCSEKLVRKSPEAFDSTSENESTNIASTPTSDISTEWPKQPTVNDKPDSNPDRPEAQMDFITNTHNNKSDSDRATIAVKKDHTDCALAIDENTLPSKQESLLAMSLVGSFYQQLELIFKQQLEKTGQRHIDISLIEKNFPEFQLMGKTALDKLLKQLVEHNLLSRPTIRKKQFCLPSNMTLSAEESIKPKETLARINAGK